MSHEHDDPTDQISTIYPANLRIIADYGTLILRDLISLVVACLIYGVYLCLFAISSRTLWRRWKESSSPPLLMALSSIVFVSQSLRLPVLFYLTIKEIKVLLGPSDESVLSDRLDVLRNEFHVGAVVHWARATTVIVADAVVVWRACVMPNGVRLFAVALSSLMVFNAGNMLVYPMMVTFARAWMREHDRAVQIQYSSGLISSVVTNFFATALIGWMGWRHHASSKKVLGILQSDPQIDKVLVTLVETGLIYLVLQLANTAVILVAPDGLFPQNGGIIIASYLMDEIILGFAAISPVVVILVVQDQTSILGSTWTELSAFRAKQPTNTSQIGATRFSVSLPNNLGLASRTPSRVF
ncbi:hypothetical protein DL96DRAFT_1610286 [Flagelloscypha sp. PMI_526]|nr:hypothetical protein DL96DRAFT_1610286 [Flagelloscypha sp. PMI_526]